MPNPFRLAVIAKAHFDTVCLPPPPAPAQRAALAGGAIRSAQAPRDCKPTYIAGALVPDPVGAAARGDVKTPSRDAMQYNGELRGGQQAHDASLPWSGFSSMLPCARGGRLGS